MGWFSFSACKGNVSTNGTPWTFTHHVVDSEPVQWALFTQRGVPVAVGNTVCDSFKW